MKPNVLLVYAVLIGCTALLGACHNEDDLLPKGPHENTESSDYFKGEINGDTISLQNNRRNTGSIGSSRASCHRFIEGGMTPDSINILSTLIRYNDRSELNVTLYDLIPGKRYLSLYFSRYWYESYIRATVFTTPSKTGENIRYVPRKTHPFLVEITGVAWQSSIHPVVEVRLDGVLYNQDYPNDSLVVRGVYKTR